jgi:hypothetical protein
MWGLRSVPESGFPFWFLSAKLVLSLSKHPLPARGIPQPRKGLGVGEYTDQNRQDRLPAIGAIHFVANAPSARSRLE